MYGELSQSSKQLRSLFFETVLKFGTTVYPGTTLTSSVILQAKNMTTESQNTELSEPRQLSVFRKAASTRDEVGYAGNRK